MFKRTILALLCLCAALSIATSASADISAVMQAGGDRLVETQYTDGGWGWPLVAPPTYGNIHGPIAMGLAKAYRATGDANMLTALQNASNFFQSKTLFSPSDGYLAAELDSILGGTANTDYVKANFYDKLAAGTYDRNGTLYDTEGYVNLIRTARSGDQANMAAWDIGIGVVGAASVGADTSAWVAGTKAEIDELDSAGYYDVIGLAGAVYGLAFIGEDYDPIAGSHAAASSIFDLASTLAGYQLSTGGFTWNAGYMSEGNESVQESAYAVLALDTVGGYDSSISSAVSYICSAQLATGGWESYVGAGENNEITGEALWAVSTVPEPGSIAALAAGLVGLGFFRRRK